MKIKTETARAKTALLSDLKPGDVYQPATAQGPSWPFYVALGNANDDLTWVGNSGISMMVVKDGRVSFASANLQVVVYPDATLVTGRPETE